MSAKVIVNGAKGRMGQASVRAVEADKDLKLVAKADREDNLITLIEQYKPDVVVDFTIATVAFENAKRIIDAGVRPVIGTSGLTLDEVAKLQELSTQKKLGGVIAPNFSLGAVLMMRFAEIAAPYYPNMEIIEFHHDNKLDAPSGTARRTAEMIANARSSAPERKEEIETISGARGGRYQDVPIHSVRLPGYVAHQEVVCGGESETLTIRHDSIHRDAFMPGVRLACQRVQTIDNLVYGLENLLD